MGRWYKVDLHIHTVLSACAELEMGPANIIAKARELDLDIIAVTDHNSGANVPAFLDRVGEGTPWVIPGMEVQTREEVHILCLFPRMTQLESFGKYLESRLPPLPNRPDIFGDQVVVNSREEILQFVDNLLTTSVNASLEEVVAAVVSREGLIIPAHVDRPAFSLLANLGFIPTDMPVSALEIAHPEKLDQLKTSCPELNKYSIVSFSDAHTLTQMERHWSTWVYLEKPTFGQLKGALEGEGERKVVVSQLSKGKTPG